MIPPTEVDGRTKTNGYSNIDSASVPTERKFNLLHHTITKSTFIFRSQFFAVTTFMILFPTFRAACGPRGPICAADLFSSAVRQKRQQSELASQLLHLKQLGKRQKRWAAIQDKVATREAAWKEISSHFVFVWFVSCFDIIKLEHPTPLKIETNDCNIPSQSASRQVPIKSWCQESWPSLKIDIPSQQDVNNFD